ncbi:MAG: pyrimidine dimer DNA glycosylase/endonuclease V [Candidatus Omnitrophota bacterium]
MHAIWTVLTQGKKGYSRHPETLRWNGKLKALYLRHEKLIRELQRRKYEHKSQLKRIYVSGSHIQNQFVDSYATQLRLLKRKKCGCKV